MGKFNLNKDKKQEESTEKKVDKLLEFRKLDERNPMEQAMKFDEVKKNPPAPDYMKVEVAEEEDDDGNTFIVSESRGRDGEGTPKRIRHDPFFTIDLNTAIMADVAKVPSNVVPMFIDKAQQLVANEKKEFKAEKRKGEFNWWWIVFFLLMIPGIIFVVLLFL